MTWELFRRHSSGGFEMVGVDGDLLTGAPIHALPVAVEITIDAPSTLPDALAPTESSIEAITEQLGGRIAATVRAASQLWTLVHLSTDEFASRFTAIPLPPDGSVSVAPSIDPDWTIFDHVRPVEIEVQSMQDMRVFAGLHMSGDVGGSRRIEHVVDDLGADQVDGFLQAVDRSVGPIESERDDATGAWTITHEGDPADITSESWTIRQIAERYGATYDGWGCGIVRGRPKRKRKWLARR